MEDLGFVERGTAWKEVLAGTFDLDGDLPVNPDGGLKSFGHPVGASGLRMMFEAWLQLRGEAPEERRITTDGPGLALTHNLGGYPGEMVSFVGVVGTELLVAAERGRSPLDERRHTLLGVGRRHGDLLGHRLVEQRTGPVGVERLVGQPFHQPDGHRRPVGQRRRQLGRPGVELLAWHHLGDEAVLLAFAVMLGLLSSISSFARWTPQSRVSR